MDENIRDRIDRYLRREMSNNESLQFEQEALNDEELRTELGLTLLVRKCLASRESKFNQIGRWKRRGRMKLVALVSVVSIVALFVVGFFAVRPNFPIPSLKEDLAMKRKSVPVNKEKQDKVRIVMNAVMHNTDDQEIVEAIDDLETQRDIPSISEMNGAQYVSNKQPCDDGESRVLMAEVYELHWMKIMSLMRMGDKDRALNLLREFVALNGVYKSQADSLLLELEKQYQ